MAARSASGEQEQARKRKQAQQGVAARTVFGERMQRLLLKLVFSAAKGDKEKTFEVAQEIMRIFEEGLEGESANA